MDFFNTAKATRPKKKEALQKKIFWNDLKGSKLIKGLKGQKDEVYKSNRPLAQSFLLSLLVLTSQVFISQIFFHNTSQAQTLEEQRLKAKQKINYLNDFTVDTNAQSPGNTDDASGATYTLGLKYSPESIKRTNFWFFARASKRFNREQTFGLLDTIVRVERSYESILGFSPRIRLQGILPTNEFVHEQTSFVGATSGQLRLSRVLGSKFYLILTSTFRWNFHNYRVSELGGINIQNTLTNAANLSYGFTPKLQAGAQVGWSWARTYKSNIRANYLFDVYGSYAFTSKWSTTLGLSTAASPLTADGQSSNINLFDERDTAYYLSLTHFM